MASFALIDCNNFFVSCERLFRPDLEGRPVVVLSSNDGCAIARSNEAKALGIPMGAPVFKYRDLFRRHNIVQFSANFELYGDISSRITRLLAEVTPHIEVYSVDESFLDLHELPIPDYDEWGGRLRGRILKEIGLPVSVGIAPTKTLAKLASHYAKATESGSFNFFGLDPAERQARLQATPIKELWGIGWRLGPKLRAEGIGNALAFAQMRPQHAQQIMGIHGRQMVMEMNGQSCHQLEPEHQVQKSIMRGRTFGEDTSLFHVLEAALASLGAGAAFRLRREGCLAKRAIIFLQTNKHKPGFRSWYLPVAFTMPTNDTGVILNSLVETLREVYNAKQSYHRAGVILLDFVPTTSLQTDLLGQVSSRQDDRSQARMRAMDTINARYGKGHLRSAAEDLSSSWQPKHQLRSPRYTTCWEELPIVRLVN